MHPPSSRSFPWNNNASAQLRVLLFISFAAAFLAFGVVGVSAEERPKDRLHAGEDIDLDQRLESAHNDDGSYYIVSTSDKTDICTFHILRASAENPDGTPIMRAKPRVVHKTKKYCSLTLENEQYFALYSDSVRGSLWESIGTELRSGSNTEAALIIQSDGNLVLYTKDVEAEGKPLWSSQSAENMESLSQ